MLQIATSRPPHVLPSEKWVKILLCELLVPAKVVATIYLFWCYRNKMLLKKKPTSTLLCLPLVSETPPLLRCSAADKNKHFPHRHATTAMKTKLLESHPQQSRDDTDQHGNSSSTTWTGSWNHRPQSANLLEHFESMNRVARPRTTVQMLYKYDQYDSTVYMSEAHHTFTHHKPKKTEHKEEVLGPTTDRNEQFCWSILSPWTGSRGRGPQCRCYTNMTNMIVRFTCQRQRNAIITWKVVIPRSTKPHHISPHHTWHSHMSPHHTFTRHKPKKREHKEEVLGPTTDRNEQFC